MFEIKVLENKVDKVVCNSVRILTENYIASSILKNSSNEVCFRKSKTVKKFPHLFVSLVCLTLMKVKYGYTSTVLKVLILLWFEYLFEIHI